MNIIEEIARADEFLNQNQPHKALQAYMNVVEYYRRNRKKLKLDDNILTAYNNAVVLALYLSTSKNEIIKVKDLAKEFLRLAKRSNNSVLYAIACFHMGVIHIILDEYRDAVEVLKEALEVFELIGDEEGVMLASKNLSIAYENLGKSDLARVYEAKAKSLAKDESFFDEIKKLLKRWKQIPWIFS